MKYLIVAGIIIGFLSCNRENRKNKTPQVNGKYTRLLSKFDNIAFDTLEVYSLGEEVTKKYIFEGTELDSMDAILFPPEIARAHFVDPPGLFSCFKFTIDSNKIGLIARTPSEYSPSSIKIFIYNKRKDTITDYIELAQYIGDAGAVRDVNSWLFRNDDKKLTSLIWIKDSFDNSVENEKDTTTEESNYYYFLDLSKDKHDTISKNQDEVIGKFSNLIKRKSATNTRFKQ